MKGQVPMYNLLSLYLLLLLGFFPGDGNLKVEAGSPMIEEKCVLVF